MEGATRFDINQGQLGKKCLTLKGEDHHWRLQGGARDTRPFLVTFCFQFCAIVENKWPKIIGLHSHHWGWCTPGNPGSATDHGSGSTGPRAMTPVPIPVNAMQQKGPPKRTMHMSFLFTNFLDPFLEHLVSRGLLNLRILTLPDSNMIRRRCKRSFRFI